MSEKKVLFPIIFLVIIISATKTMGISSNSSRFPTHRLYIKAASIEVAFEPQSLNLKDEAVLEWVSRAERAVEAYYGRFPLNRLLVVLRPTDGRDIEGTTFGGENPSIIISVGRETTEEDLNDDWVMTHEMIHCAFPSVGRPAHAWIEEGIATYVEPLARLRTGDLSPEKVWGDLIHCLPQGLPGPEDQGLDNTQTWGRTYWGGALFCLLADIEIRQRTGNRKGLEDALRGILQNDGNVTFNWELSHALDEGDRATGVPVLKELYQAMRATPVYVDLPTLWHKLGIEIDGDTVTFNDNAPLAPIRRAITEGR